MLRIALVGRPRAHRDGAMVAVRGRKTWALLAYLLLTERPPSRQRMAELLFPDADDPAGALRWTLSQLRPLLGEDGSVGGDPLTLTLTDVEVDVRLVLDGDPAGLALPELGEPFLDRVDPPASASFELWLAETRRTVEGATADLLHAAAVEALAAADAAAALGWSERLVGVTPLEEGAHMLRLHALRLAGDEAAARRHASRAASVISRETGRRATALEGEVAAAAPARRTHGRATVEAQLDAGRAAALAGAHASAVEAFRGAVVAARALDDPDLLARSLQELGSALVHGVRGTDDEGAAVLREALDHARSAGAVEVAATAARELGYVDVLRGRYRGALRWLAAASELARSDQEQAWVLAVSSMAHADVGRHDLAVSAADQAVGHAHRADAPPPAAFASTSAGRSHLLTGHLDAAAAALDDALATARTADWTAFVPWPESLRAEVALEGGDRASAADAFTHAFALGVQLGDPCWESIAGRGLGRVAEQGGDWGEALELFTEAASSCRRLPDTYVWVEAYAIDAVADLATRVGAPDALARVEELEAVATPRGMRELVARAALYRVRLDVPGALDRAGSLLADTVNPRLARALEQVRVHA